MYFYPQYEKFEYFDCDEAKRKYFEILESEFQNLDRVDISIQRKVLIINHCMIFLTLILALNKIYLKV